MLPTRWVAEHTFAWLMNSRRLARDYETLPKNSEAMIRWSMVTRMRRRLARPRAADRHCTPPTPPGAATRAPPYVWPSTAAPDLRRCRRKAQLHRDLLGSRRSLPRLPPLSQHTQNPLVVRCRSRHRQPVPPGGTVEPGTGQGEDAVSSSAAVTAVLSAALTSGPRPVPPARSPAAPARSRLPPAFATRRHRAPLERKAETRRRMPPSPRAKPCLTRRNQAIKFG